MVYVFLTTDHETVEALTIVDLLRRANIPVTTVSIEPTLSVTSSLGITVLADKLYEECDFSDMEALVLPGGPGHMNLYHHTKLASLILETYEKKTLIAAICAAPKVLSSLHIHVKSTIYPTLTDCITSYVDTSVCVTDYVITGNALGASIPFTLALISRLRGESTSQTVADGIVYPPTPS